MVVLFLLWSLLSAASSDAMVFGTAEYKFPLFNESNYDVLAFSGASSINLGALQITPNPPLPNGDGPIRTSFLENRVGRTFLNQSFVLWTDSYNDSGTKTSYVASFNSSFLLIIYRLNRSEVPAEGMSFLIAPELTVPEGSFGQFLGLTNLESTDLESNHLVAIEFDNYKQDFDPDDNHIGLNINSVISNKTVSLSEHDFQLAPPEAIFWMVWVQYDGASHNLSVFMANHSDKNSIPPRPTNPILTANLNLKDIVKQKSYFGFSASTGSGSNVQLNSVLRWNLTVEDLPGNRWVENHFPKKKNKGLKMKIVFALGLGLVGLAAVLLGYYVSKRLSVAASDPLILGTLRNLPGTPREFSFTELKKGTNNFDDKCKLGQGGFGVVYRGLLVKENNRQVAVKKFSREEVNSKEDFLAELTIINRLRHKHLVQLLGWCHKKGMLLIVYEYMPNGSLDNHLFRSNTVILEWRQRYKIVSGVASALHYLHNEYNQRVLHRDLKASNIMLDSNFDACLGDFGLARALDNEKTSYAELEGVHGTLGYIAPECFHTGKATRESDVYAFGAVLLEVSCGQRPWAKMGGFHLLVDWVWSLHREGRLLEAMDERLGTEYTVEEAQTILLLGLVCMHPIADERPKTHDLPQILSGLLLVPRVPPFKPAFVWPSAMPEGLDCITTNSDTEVLDPSPSDQTSQSITIDEL